MQMGRCSTRRYVIDVESDRDTPSILLYGYGNPGRQDDGLGPRIAAAIEKLRFDHVAVDANYQPHIEDAAEIAEHDLVLFVDTTVEDVESYFVRQLHPAKKITFTSHLVSPESILAMCEDMYGRVPEAWIIGIRGYEFEYREGFSEHAWRNYRQALDFITSLIRLYGESAMAQKTVLIIDDDADIRASIRIVLEAAGFSVGEAGDAKEGLKVAGEVNPDAVIVDLMMETVDAGSKLSAQLKEDGFDGPIYLLSAAGDAVRYNIDAKELGLAGIFQKPIQHEVLINTLKKSLKIG
jgi:hydrogenase maturation protease